MKRIGEIGIDINGNLVKILYERGTIMEQKPEFTREQEDWICYQIGEWYLEWKDKIILNSFSTDEKIVFDPARAFTHNLGIAKEDLKLRLCKIK